MCELKLVQIASVMVDRVFEKVGLVPHGGTCIVTVYAEVTSDLFMEFAMCTVMSARANVSLVQCSWEASLQCSSVGVAGDVVRECYMSISDVC